MIFTTKRLRLLVIDRLVIVARPRVYGVRSIWLTVVGMR